MALTHAIFPRVMPHVYSWINKYGKSYLSWNGVRPQLVITDPEIVKEVLRNSEKAFPKGKPTNFFEKMLDKMTATNKQNTKSISSMNSKQQNRKQKHKASGA
ncbi:hypothetical protein ES288_D07G230100v1 [Gossypium darwinii]|uniref:Cytochrome P450 n=1 Tax=Gossypium darwinii TaxID=34276 RepID=A0A5D2BZI6_GOSDA|nr:hypothetical protein ES288_D07G230100v1 [Gossypium darwinii]